MLDFAGKRGDLLRYFETFRSSDFIAPPCGVSRLMPVKPANGIADQPGEQSVFMSGKE